jgi:hypothetical protein
MGGGGECGNEVLGPESMHVIIKFKRGSGKN